VPVFEAGKSATENSIIAVGDSLVVENNYGYEGPTSVAQGKSTTPGVARVDVNEQAGTCTKVWTSAEISPTTVPKASLANGLVYVYSKPPRSDGVDAWYFTAIDFHTGKTVYRRLTGTGYLYNNHYAAVSIGPDGAGYIGTLGGLIRIADG
jgi:glucose dehydrogenase